MSSLSTNWLKLNKLLDQYKKEDRDISVTICYNISWDSLLLHTFRSHNNTAIHYATVTLPKVLSFPSSLAIFSSLEKCSLLLQALLELVCRTVREGNEVTNELDKCNNTMCLHYLKLQTNSPNVRRVCSVFCENLLEIVTQVLELCPEDCSCVFEILKSSLFHPSLSEDYTNLFRNKHRKTDHIQKLFSILDKLGDSENIQTLKSLFRSLPIIFKSFLTAYKEVQTNDKQFPISGLNQFMSGIKLSSPHFYSLPLPGTRLECLSLLLQDLELHLRVFPNDPELISAETATFSEILDQLIVLYPLYPVETALCMTSIQQIDHLLLQAKLRDIFITVFSSEICSKRLLDCVFEVYYKLNQLDKLIVIIIRVVGEMENTLLRLPEQIKETTQKYFAKSSLNTCNRCSQLLITGLQEGNNNGVVLLSDMLSSIILVSPVGDINTTLSQKNSFLQIITQLHSLLQTYTAVRIYNVLCYLTLLHGYLFVVTVLSQLAFSRDLINSLQRLDVKLMNWFIIPNVWVEEWSDVVSKYDKDAMKRIEEIQMNILLTLSRFPEYNTISISASEVQTSLSSSIEQVLSSEIDPANLTSLIQYSSIFIHNLTHNAMSVLSQQILTAVTNKQCDSTLSHVLYSSQFKELTPLHTYLCYNAMIQAVKQIRTGTPLKGLVVEFYNKLIDKAKIDSQEIIREINSTLTSRIQREDGKMEIELSSLAIIPLSHISLQLKLNILLGLQVLLVAVTDKESIQLILDSCVVVLKGLKDRNTSKLGEYLCDMKQLIMYIYEVAIENTLECFQLFTETCGILFDRNSEEFLSLTNHLITLWRVNIRDIPVQLYELTYAVLDRSVRVCEELRNVFNTLVEVTTPVLLKILKRPQSTVGHVMKLLSVNINYILLSHKQEASEQTEEAIDTIVRQLVNFIYKFDMNDCNTLQSLTDIADTLTHYSYSVDIHIDRISPVSTHEQFVMVVRWIGCSHISSFKTFLEGEKIELIRFCDILGRVVEGNIPDSHRREIRKSFSSILIKLTDFLTDRQLEEKDTLACLNFLTAIFKLPNRIGLSSRSVVQGITCLTILDTTTNILCQIIHSKCVCLLHLIHNYSDCTISCIPIILLLTKHVIKSVFHLDDDTEFPILTRLLESYTSLPPLSNYTHHLVQQYIVTSQEWPQKQLIKKTLKSSIFALIGFSKPETLLSLQAQLDITGRSYFKDLKEEYDKFYKFKGKT